MDYEKLYKEALERAKKMFSSKEIDYLFPELEESDERIRGAILYFISHTPTVPKGLISKEDMIGWLEKQGEQKSNKVSIWKHWKDGIAGNGEGKPIYLIKVGNTYSLTSCLGFECDYIELSELDNLMLEKQGEEKPTNKVEPKFKVGDTICRKGYSKQTIKSIYDKCDPHVYICRNDEGFEAHIPLSEQDEWDIEQNLTDEDNFNEIKTAINSFYCEANADELIEWLESLKNRTIPQQEWTKEDKDIIENIMAIISGCKERDSKNISKSDLVEDYDKAISWLDSLKNRVKPQQKQEWSKEDEYTLNETIQHLEELIRIDIAKHCGCDVQYYQRDIDWLKSLKDRYTWKPSDEQMEALDKAIYDVDDPIATQLAKLIGDLKKL